MECEDGTIHLVGGDHISRGRVEFCYDGRWYSICATDWGAEQTRVVCKTLRGYGPPYGKKNKERFSCSYIKFL